MILTRRSSIDSRSNAPCRDIERDSEYVGVAIRWQRGFTSRHEVVRPVRSYEQLRDLDKHMDRIAALRDEGYTTAQIADARNREGFSPPKRRRGFLPDLNVIVNLLPAYSGR